MQFSRFFTRSDANQLEAVKVEVRHAHITGTSFAMDITCPSSWSANASNVVAQKYLRKAGVPNKVVPVEEDGIPAWCQRSVPAKDAEFGAETDIRQAVRRMAGAWTYWGFRKGLFDSEEDGKVFYDELCHTLIHQMWAPNSPQWFNTGLHWAYGIEGPAQGHHYYDEDLGKVVPSTSAYERPQPHACFIQSVDDDLVNEGGIMDLWLREARLFKYGSGTGTNFSSLRGKGESLSGGGQSSGLMSWLKIGDRAAAGIKSGGTTRRAAKMVILDVDHPEIFDFVNWKVKEEQKVAALVAGSKACESGVNQIIAACHGMDGEGRFDPKKNDALANAIVDARRASVPDGYIYRAIEFAREGYTKMEFPVFDTGWQSEAYETVAGQQSNNSVGVTQDFLESAELDTSWTLTRRTDGTPFQTVSASELWGDICYAAWACADPGLHYQTTMNDWHTCPQDGDIRGSNPCSEYLFLDDTACNLASINLVAFEGTSDDVVDLLAYKHVICLVTTVLELSVAMSQLPSETIAKKTWAYRTLGLGYANLGALLMRRGLPYDSVEGRSIAACLTSILTGDAYVQSALLAKQFGPFDRFAANRSDMMRVIRNHRRAAYGASPNEYEGLSVRPVGLVAGDGAPDTLLAMARNSWDQALQLGEMHGYRNAQVSAIAPTGTIGIAMDCDTTGIEPDYSLVKYKELAGGGGMMIVNQSVPVALRNLGYSDRQVEDIKAYIMGTRTLGDLAKVLEAAGFTSSMVAAAESAIQTAPHLTVAINTFSLGREAILRATKLNAEQLESGEHLLVLLGMSHEQIYAYNEKIFGTMTIEGAPHIRSEHLPVFDCASKCGTKGQRFIAARGHVNMMGSVQPFVSGAISKTVNMPRESSIADVRAIYHRAWKLGLKAIAIYRDGSKLSQPLESRLVADLFDGLEQVQRDSSEPLEPKVIHQVTEKLVVRYLRDRRKLPWTRGGHCQKVIIGGHKIFLHTGEYEDGTLGEIFIDSHKEGAAFRSLLGAFAIAVSVGLQHGVPLERFVELYTFTRFEPNGIVMGDPNIKTCTSLVDYIFRHLAVRYLGRNDLAQVYGDLQSDTMEPEPEWEVEKVLDGVQMFTTVPIDVNSPGFPMPDTEEQMLRQTFHTDASVGSIVSPQVVGSVMNARVESHVGVELDTAHHHFDVRTIARSQGYEGDPCPSCGQLKLVKNGACSKCVGCGASTGCS
jgi:ribonucleoside-diphosphate reductase alpha chain